ncbi:MAG TPA: hypothetical protein VIV11_12605 [Kofleriaceae bacterium]
MQRLMAIVTFVLFAGCVPLSYAYTPATSNPVARKPAGCKFDIHTTTPTQGYSELGTLKHYNGEAPKDTEKFRKAVAEQVCDVGGDAVIVTTNEKGLYTTGSVVKYVGGAEPVKPVQDMPSVQQSDTEVPTK